MVWRWGEVHRPWVDGHRFPRAAPSWDCTFPPRDAPFAPGVDEDTRSQGETGEEREEHHQSGCKAPEELPPQTEKLVDFSSARQFRSRAQTAIEKRFWKSIPELPDAAECLPRRVKARSVCFNRT